MTSASRLTLWIALCGLDQTPNSPAPTGSDRPKRTDGEGYTWDYALARMNSVELRASYRDNPVWSVPTLPWREVIDRPDKPYTAGPVRK